MPWFPVIAEEIAAAEARLGIALPLGYRAIVGNPKTRTLLAHPTVGAIDLNTTMAEFVEHTERRRATLPGFPARGVVAMEGPGRYIRFWLPDPKRPGILSETVYAWDTVEGKQSKDASGLAILKSMIDLVSSEPAIAALRPTPLPFVVQAIELPTSEGDWTSCGLWETQGNYITATDLGELPARETPATLRLPAGRYRIEVRLHRRAADEAPVIAAWRMLRVEWDATLPLVSEPIATIDVDLGAIAVYDRQPFFARLPPADRDGFVSALMEVGAPLASLRVGDADLVHIVRSGDGDGSYPMEVLRSGTENVGVALQFLGAD